MAAAKPQSAIPGKTATKCERKALSYKKTASNPKEMQNHNQIQKQSIRTPQTQKAAAIQRAFFGHSNLVGKHDLSYSRMVVFHHLFSFAKPHSIFSKKPLDHFFRKRLWIKTSAIFQAKGSMPRFFLIELKSSTYAAQSNIV